MKVRGFILALTILTISTAAWAEGALVRGFTTDGRSEYAFSFDYATKDLAIDAATRRCITTGFSNCALVTTFQNSCIYFASNHTLRTNAWYFNELQLSTFLSECNRIGFNCGVQQSVCDKIIEAPPKQAQPDQQTLPIPPKPQEVIRSKELDLARKEAEAALKLAADTAEELKRLKESLTKPPAPAPTGPALNAEIVTLVIGGLALSVLGFGLTWRHRGHLTKQLRTAYAALMPKKKGQPAATTFKVPPKGFPHQKAVPASYVAEPPIAASSYPWL